MHDQNFYDKHIIVRSLENKMFSFLQRYVFFTEENSLITKVSQFPFLEDNDITKKCILIGGELDIGKYFRSIEFPFYLKNDTDEFKISEGEIFSYISFNTKEKINFKRFFWSKKIKEYEEIAIKNLSYKNKFYTNTSQFYKNFRYKKTILKEIKNNLAN
jgi:hypothetical protein